MAEGMEEITEWLKEVASRIKFPLRKKAFKLEFRDVVLAVELYKMRHIDTFYIEFSIYNDEVSRAGNDESDGGPLFDDRLVDPRVSRPDGSHPHFPIPQGAEDQLEFIRAQVVEQGSAIFHQVHSLKTLHRAYRGQVPEISVKGLGGVAGHIADRIEAALSRRG